MNRIQKQLVIVLALVGALAIGCGGDTSKVDGATARSAVEKAAGITLKQGSVPADAKKEGLDEQYSNQTTAAADKQLVLLFTLKDTGTLEKVKDQLKSSVPGSDVKLFTHENIVVVYGANGTDKGAAVKAAVEGLKE